MSNTEYDPVVEWPDLEVTTGRCASGRMGLVLCGESEQAHEPEAIAHLRDLLTNFLVDNGYE